MAWNKSLHHYAFLGDHEEGVQSAITDTIILKQVLQVPNELGVSKLIQKNSKDCYDPKSQEALL